MGTCVGSAWRASRIKWGGYVENHLLIPVSS